MSRTDHELLLARAWAMLREDERTAIEYTFRVDGYGKAREYLNKLADEWIEELRAEKVRIRKS